MCVDKFFKAAHRNVSSSDPSVASKCPFRASLQRKGIHDSAVVSSVPQASPCSSKKGEQPNKSGEGDNSGNCRCANSGKAPKGKVGVNL